MSDNWHYYAENGCVYLTRPDRYQNRTHYRTREEAQSAADRQRERGGRITLKWTGNQLDNARADDGIAADMIEQARTEVAERLGRLIHG
jgi:hypothetical protein